MGEEAETKAIEKWLRIVDKPLAKKEADKKDAEPREESGLTHSITTPQRPFAGLYSTPTHAQANERSRYAVWY